METDYTISEYDRLYASLHDISALSTRPSTVKNVQSITGKAKTFVIETVRHEELGDHIFVECIDESGVVRLALPPKVARLIVSQRDSLTTRRRSRDSKAAAVARMKRGELPGFMKKRAT